ncbi:MAG: hypothetical protein IKD89_02550 [Clostridia bacterium]|nr:hypothetical protein [Clostridia bacterium]
MKLIELLCPRCGAVLKVDPSNTQAHCEHCGAVLLIDYEVRTIRVEDAEEVGYNFEKGRQRAQAEAKKASSSSQTHYTPPPRDDYRESPKYNPPRETPAEPEPVKKERRPWLLWLLGWIFIFPLPLAMVMSKHKKLGEVARISIMAAASLIYISVFLAVFNSVVPVMPYHLSNNKSYLTNYRGESGYVVISEREEYIIKNSDDFQDKELWTAPTYKYIGFFWIKTGSLPHKTEVVVRDQLGGHYSKPSYLLVERKDDKSRYYIAIQNYSSVPYWTWQDRIDSAPKYGALIAEYRQVSEYRPVNVNGEELEIPDGTIVLLTGITSQKTERKIYAEYWAEGSGGRSVMVYFNSDDLTIVY